MNGRAAGLVLAGGRSSRMGGGDKSLESIGGRTIVRRVIDRLAPHLDHVAINANGDATRFAAYGLPVVADRIDNYQGPLEGILAGLEWAAGLADIRWLVTVPGDTPFIPDDLVPRLLRQAEASGGIVLAASAGRPHPVCGVWPLAIAASLDRHLSQDGSRRVMDFASAMTFQTVDFPVDDLDPFFNVNTPDDLATARARADG